MTAYQTYISEELDEATKNLLEEYWHIENDKFSNRAKDILVKYCLTKGSLIKILRENSYCDKIVGKCVGCGVEIKVRGYSQGAFDYVHSRSNRICEDCDKKFERKRIEEKKLRDEESKLKIEDEKLKAENEKRLNFEKVFSDKRWFELMEYERDILLKIIENRTKEKIYKNVFNGDPYNRSIWEVVNRIVKLGLLKIQRTGSGSIIKFEFDEKLETEIKSFKGIKELPYFQQHLKKTSQKPTQNYPDYTGIFTLENDFLFQKLLKYEYSGWIKFDDSINLKLSPPKDKNIKALNIDDSMNNVLSYLHIQLEKITNNPSYNQPHFSGTFVPTNDVILKAKEKYVYSGWLHFDELLRLKITPLKDIPKRDRTSDVKREPKSIREILLESFQTKK